MSRPSGAPMPRPSAEQVSRPSAEPMPRPSAEPVPRPSAEPMHRPSAEPMPRPSAEPMSRWSSPSAPRPAPRPSERLRPRNGPPNAGGNWDEDEVPAGVPGRPLNAPLQVPVSSVLGMGAAIVFMTVTSFFVGRCSVGDAPKSRALEEARPALSLLPLITKALLPVPPKPCWVSRQPVMWANKADRNIPFDLFSPKSGLFTLGYAADEKTAFGLEINAASGEVVERFSTQTEVDIKRVTPTLGDPGFAVLTNSEGQSLQPLARVPDERPFFIGVQGSSVALSPSLAVAPTTLWPLEKEGNAIAARVQIVGDKGYAVLLRLEKTIWGGFLDRDRKPVGSLTQVAGSGGAVGKKPMSGWNGKQLAVIFSDRPADGERYEMRVGLAPAGAIPASTTVIALPKGGPGGDVFTPDIAGLPDGRWVLVWTEGSSGSRAIRAQTLAPDLTPLGDPIALSPPAGDFGQGVLGVTEGYMSVVFLSRGKGSYELWGAMLQCG